MYDYQLEDEDKELKKVGLELMFMTPEKCSSADGITAVELAKLVELPLETVKKKLNILKDNSVVRVKGSNPKYLYAILMMWTLTDFFSINLKTYLHG